MDSWTVGLLVGLNVFVRQSNLRVFSTSWSYRLSTSAAQTWLDRGHKRPPDWMSPMVQHYYSDEDDDGDEAGEDSLSALGNWVPFDLWTNRTSGEKVKVMLTPHWIAAVPAAPLRRLTHVYILKRKNFRIVFSVSNPFLTLASINIWIFKAFDPPTPLSVWPLTCLVAFWHLCFAFLLFLFRMCVYYHGIIYSAVWSIRVVGNLYWYLLPSACWCVYCNTGVTVIN